MMTMKIRCTVQLDVIIYTVTDSDAKFGSFPNKLCVYYVSLAQRMSKCYYNAVEDLPLSAKDTEYAPLDCKGWCSKASRTVNQAYSKYKHSLRFRVRRYVVTPTKSMHRLQIRPIVHN